MFNTIWPIVFFAVPTVCFMIGVALSHGFPQVVMAIAALLCLLATIVRSGG